MKYLVLLASVCIQSITWAQRSGNLHYQQSEIKNNVAAAEMNDEAITFSVSGLLNAKADEYVAFFHVLQVGETAEATDKLTNDRIQKFKDRLRTLGMDTATVHTAMISFVPKYDYNVLNKLFSKTYNEVPDGFEMQKNVIVRYEKASAIDAIITAAASAEIYDLVKVEYFLKDIKKQYDQLRLQCIQTLNERRKSFEILGIKLDTLKMTFADDFGTILPQQRYGQYQAVARPSMDAVKKSAGGASFNKFRSAELTPSRYYEAASYEQYDVIVNPVVDEPMVQLTCQLRIKFFLDTKELHQQNILFLGVNGQLQKVELKSP